MLEGVAAVGGGGWSWWWWMLEGIAVGVTVGGSGRGRWWEVVHFRCPPLKEKSKQDTLTMPIKGLGAELDFKRAEVSTFPQGSVLS